MLLNIIVFRDGASLVINGEKVFDISFNTANIELPSKLSFSGDDQDWLAFYSYSDISQFEIDCVAIYSYRIPSAISKRRWVYGQAIDFPENLLSPYSGESFLADYTFANYSNNYIYPDIARWSQGISENISSNNKVLQPPNYSLPEIVFNNKNKDIWENSLSDSYANGISLKPSNAWVDTDGYLFFNSASILQQKTEAFYGVFEQKIGFDSTETLFRLENQVNGNYLDVELHTVTKAVESISSETITLTGHELSNNDIVRFSDSATGPVIVSGTATAVSTGSPNNLATVTTLSTSHNLYAGQGVVLSGFGANDPESPTINGTYLVVSVPSENTFTISFSAILEESVPFGSFSGGTITQLGIVKGKEYFVTKVSNNSFYISNSKGGMPIKVAPLSSALSLIGNLIRYKLKFGTAEEYIVYQTPTITMGHTFVAGIDFVKFKNYFGGNLSSFVSNRNQLRLYAGGNKNFNKTFSGYIYRIGFSTKRNLAQLNYLFDVNGIPFLRYQFDGNGVIYSLGQPEETINAGYVYEDYINDILFHKASYTLTLRSFFGNKYLDIATSSYWQDYVPLSYFAKNYIDIDGKKKYGIDFIQFNSDAPLPNSFDNNEYDSSYLPVQTYVSFQLNKLGATKPEESFTNKNKAPRSRVITPGSDWQDTIYEVVNGTIIYPPSNVDINTLSIVIHADISSEGIIKNPARIRSIGLSGKTLNAITANPIGTRGGVQVIPYKKYGFYFEYKTPNPYVIYNDSTPHLYLTKNTGLELTGTFGEEDRGISIPVNRQRRSEYKLSAIQFAMRFGREDIVSEPIQVFEVDNNLQEDRIKIWIEPTLPSDKRFRLYATDFENNPIDYVKIYINGKAATNSVITIDTWNMIGIGLGIESNMSNQTGRINFVGPILFNNVSYYALSSTQNAQKTISDEDVYVGVDLSEIYSVFVGTNKIIVGDNFPIFPENYRYAFINGISAQSAIVKPV
jgi:hypothetical protein